MTSSLRRPDDMQPILIVDDNDDDVEAARRAFSKTNLANPIARARSGEEALRYLRGGENTRPGIILLDLNMPGLDGRQTLDAIKQSADLRRIPVVILTTSSDERDVKSCYELGANTYIQKPVDFDGLIAAIRRLTEYWFEIALLPNGHIHGG